MTAAIPVPAARSGPLATLDQLAAISEEEVWLASQKSPRTRRAYRHDVAHFMQTLGIITPGQLRQVDHRAVIRPELTERPVCTHKRTKVERVGRLVGRTGFWDVRAAAALGYGMTANT